MTSIPIETVFSTRLDRADFSKIERDVLILVPPRRGLGFRHSYRAAV